MKTYEDLLDYFVENVASNSNLAKEVFEQMGADAEEIISRPSDYQDASAGIGGFIYYNETIPFAKNNLDDILQSANDWEQMTGSRPNIDESSETSLYNNYAWFAVEFIMMELSCFVETRECERYIDEIENPDEDDEDENDD